MLSSFCKQYCRDVATFSIKLSSLYLVATDCQCRNIVQKFRNCVSLMKLCTRFMIRVFTYITRESHFLWIYLDMMMPSNLISRTIRSIMYRNMELGAKAWAKVSPDTIQRWWDTFQTEVRWDPEVTSSAEVYRLFLQRAASRYTNMLSRVKKAWVKDKKRQRWDLNVWNDLVRHWNDPKTIKKSEQPRKNRLSEPGGSGTGHGTHKGGARGAAEVAQRIEERMGRPAYDWEIVEYYHR